MVELITKYETLGKNKPNGEENTNHGAEGAVFRNFDLDFLICSECHYEI